ncbi:MAG: hypothetical protein ACTSRG_25900 [Candidatus Helarchaeota archaeon]
MMEFGVPLVTFIMQKIINKVTSKIYNKIQERKAKKRYRQAELDFIYAKIKTRFPYINGIGKPWIGIDIYNKSYISTPIKTSVKFEDNQMAIISLLLPRLEILPIVRSSAGVLEIKVPYSSEIDLEVGDNFLGENSGIIRVLFPTPFNSI